MVVALAILLVCLSMLLIYAFARAEERRLERGKHGIPSSGPRSKVN